MSDNASISAQTSVQQKPDLFESMLFYLLISVVALAPLPLASNRPLPAAILCLAVGLLVIAWAIGIAWGKRMAVAPSRLLWPLLCFGVVCCWIIIQWLPWVPPSFADPAWLEAANTLGISLAGRISVNPDATLTGLMHLLAYAAVFWLSLQLTAQDRRARTAILSIAMIGAAYAFYGLIIYLTGNKSILIYTKWTYGSSLTSTFVNRNSFATFAGLTLLCAVTVLLEHLRPLFKLHLRPRLKLAMILEDVLIRRAWMTLSILIIAIALLFSQSRAGAFATLLGLACIISVFLGSQSMTRWRALSFLLLIMGIGAAVFLASGKSLSDRLAMIDVSNSYAGRNMIYVQTLDAIRASPWTGTGFGTFADVYPAFRSNTDRAPLLWDKAHNTYLENALELGVPACLVLNLSIFLLAMRCLRGINQRKSAKSLPALGLGATLLVAFHSCFDFSLQIPAVSVLYAFIMGVAVSQSWSPRQTKISAIHQARKSLSNVSKL